MDHLEFFFRQFEIIEDVMMMALDIPKVSSVTSVIVSQHYNIDTVTLSII